MGKEFQKKKKKKNPVQHSKVDSRVLQLKITKLSIWKNTAKQKQYETVNATQRQVTSKIALKKKKRQASTNLIVALQAQCITIFRKDCDAKGTYLRDYIIERRLKCALGYNIAEVRRKIRTYLLYDIIQCKKWIG